MQQISEAFDLLSRTASDHKVEWQLVEAKTNSLPFRVTGEAFDPIADEQAKEFLRAAELIKRRQLSPAWDEDDTRQLAANLFLRVRHGAILEIGGGAANDPVVVWDEPDVIPAVEAILNTPERPPPRVKNQMGSIEGEIVSVTTLDKDRKPAVTLRERKSGQEISCELSPELAKELGPHSFHEVWQHKRVTMRGLIKYGLRGNVRRLIATSASIITPRDVSIEEISDPDFTGGLDSAEYLKRLRDGDLG